MGYRPDSSVLDEIRRCASRIAVALLASGEIWGRCRQNMEVLALCKRLLRMQRHMRRLSRLRERPQVLRSQNRESDDGEEEALESACPARPAGASGGHRQLIVGHGDIAGQLMLVHGGKRVPRRTRASTVGYERLSSGRSREGAAVTAWNPTDANRQTSVPWLIATPTSSLSDSNLRSSAPYHPWPAKPDLFGGVSYDEGCCNINVGGNDDGLGPTGAISGQTTANANQQRAGFEFLTRVSQPLDAARHDEQS